METPDIATIEVKHNDLLALGHGLIHDAKIACDRYHEAQQIKTKAAADYGEAAQRVWLFRRMLKAAGFEDSSLTEAFERFEKLPPVS